MYPENELLAVRDNVIGEFLHADQCKLVHFAFLDIDIL